jgi:hypothetical protein
MSRPRPSPLAYWHLLSLDAPTVAAVWTIFLARCAGLRLPWAEPAAMFVAVWMIYAADRLLDARVLDSATASGPASGDDGLEERHRFHHAHRGRFVWGIVAGALALVFLLRQTDTRALRLYALLAALLAGWLLVVHASTRSSGQRLPKEIAVGLFFAAAVFIPTVGRVPRLQAALLPTGVLLAACCALNCLFLYAWEHPGGGGRAPLGPHSSTRWAIAHLSALTTVLVTAAVVAAVLQRGAPGGAPAGAIGLSAGLLWGLHRMRRRVPAVDLRAAADMVLLTPVIWLAWWR